MGSSDTEWSQGLCHYGLGICPSQVGINSAFWGSFPDITNSWGGGTSSLNDPSPISICVCRFPIPAYVEPTALLLCIPGRTARLPWTLSSGISVDSYAIGWCEPESGSPLQYLLHITQSQISSRATGSPASSPDPKMLQAISGILLFSELLLVLCPPLFLLMAHWTISLSTDAEAGFWNSGTTNPKIYMKWTQHTSEKTPARGATGTLGLLGQPSTNNS